MEWFLKDIQRILEKRKCDRLDEISRRVDGGFFRGVPGGINGEIREVTYGVIFERMSSEMLGNSLRIISEKIVEETSESSLVEIYKEIFEAIHGVIPKRFPEGIPKKNTEEI